MTDDPIQMLRDELIAAAHRNADTAPAQTRRWRATLKRPAIIGLAAIAAAAPAAAALTDSFPFDHGTTRDGSTYTITKAVAATPNGSADCTQTEIHNPDGTLQSRAIGCRAQGTAPSAAPVEAGFTFARDQSIVVSGTVIANTSRVTVTGVDKPITLGPATDGRRAFSVVVSAPGATITAFDDAGNVLGKITLPA